MSDWIKKINISSIIKNTFKKDEKIDNYITEMVHDIDISVNEFEINKLTLEMRNQTQES